MQDDSFQRGIVTFFYVQKGYGFIRSDDGKEIFFHLAHRGGPYLLKMSSLIDTYLKVLVGSSGSMSISSRLPVVGSRLYFYPIKSERGGLRTRIWTFEDDWDDAIEKFRQTQFGVFRIREVIKGGLWVKTPKLLFRGNREDLEAAYPSGQVHAELQTINRPNIKVSIAFRVKTDEGWMPCQDPRTNRVYSTHDVMGLRPMPVPR